LRGSERLKHGSGGPLPGIRDSDLLDGITSCDLVEDLRAQLPENSKLDIVDEEFRGLDPQTIGALITASATLTGALISAITALAVRRGNKQGRNWKWNCAGSTGLSYSHRNFRRKIGNTRLMRRQQWPVTVIIVRESDLQ